MQLDTAASHTSYWSFCREQEGLCIQMVGFRAAAFFKVNVCHTARCMWNRAGPSDDVHLDWHPTNGDALAIAVGSRVLLAEIPSEELRSTGDKSSTTHEIACDLPTTTCIAFSPSGRHLAAATQHGQVQHLPFMLHILPTHSWTAPLRLPALVLSHLRACPSFG